MIILEIKKEKNIDQQLLNLTKEAFMDAQEDPDFELDDYMLFSYIVNDIQSLIEEKIKPHLVIFDMNKWYHFQEYIDKAMDLLGYEYIGCMDDSEGQYKFNANDPVYDVLFRYKDINCDYTKVSKFID